MTALLLEADSFSQTIAQGVPKMKGRAIISFGNEVPAYGLSYPGIGNATFGFYAELGGQYATVGVNYQFPHFEASGSGCEFGPGSDFYATINGQTSIFLNQLSVDLFGCGEFSVVERDNPSINKEGIMLLSGATLETASDYIINSGTGSYSVTGLGFPPDLVFFTYFGRGAFGRPPIAFGDRGVLCVGAFDGSDQWAMSTTSGGYLVGGGRSSRSSASHVVIEGNADSIHNPIAAVSLDGDGFTLNWEGVNESIVQWYAIHDPDGQFKVGMGTEGDSSLGVGFPADCIVFANSGCTALDANQTGCSIGVGGCDSLGRQLSGWGAGGAMESNAAFWSPSAMTMAKHPNAGAPVLDAEAVLTGIDTNTPSLNWTTGGGGGMRFGWAAMRLSDATGFDGCGFTPQIYRWVQ